MTKQYHVKSLFDTQHLANTVEIIERYLNEESKSGYDFVTFENDRDYPVIITAKDI